MNVLPDLHGLEQRTQDDTARRVYMNAQVGRLIDLRREASDDHALTDAERVRELVVSLGRVAECERPGEMEAALVEHLAECQAWIEILLRDGAA